MNSRTLLGLLASGRDEAVAIAARIPDARNGSIEVRPIRVFNQ